ncbi:MULTISPECIES: hypothetical protein [unclassified Pseudomonas]|uniref:hypothetical protein n=1 Tax=unclassified Pseudomonas TaxID=196821 RepID=UPI0002F3C294|nr:hypothetical protein [Pseudomonas sp. M47T1]
MAQSRISVYDTVLVVMPVDVAVPLEYVAACPGSTVALSCQRLRLAPLLQKPL